MMGLLATKIGMTQLFMDDGDLIPVTVLKVNSNIIVGKKTNKLNGYSALQIAYGDIREKLLNKAEIGFFNKINILHKKHIREFIVNENELNLYELGQSIDLNIFKKNFYLNASSISKGKGFQGVMKRYNFKGFKATHGSHESFRGGGSIGQCTEPGKVFKGKKMPGRMGGDRVTIRNLFIVKILIDENLICIRGCIPGGKKSIVELRASNKKYNVISKKIANSINNKK